ncbi:unnamed protein product [Owenia fusiformis]|uniref:Uncharacterized protein n=1 Tax=Owenia fusiformis TaxID=6347 RepID=A0A8J1TY03_OWEFU|nr:unnamed protein product [Owenia fusiformis]
MGSTCVDLSVSIQDYIIKQCTQKLNFTQSLEIDGVMCVSLDKNAPDVVIQIHRCIVPSTAWKNMSQLDSGPCLPANTDNLLSDFGQTTSTSVTPKPPGSKKRRKGGRKKLPAVHSVTSENQNAISPGNYFVLDQPAPNLNSNVPCPQQEGFVSLGPPFVLDANHPLSTSGITTFSTPLAGVPDQLHWNSVPAPTPMALYDVTRQVTIDIGDMNQTTNQQPSTSLAVGQKLDGDKTPPPPKNAPLVKPTITNKSSSKKSAKRKAAPVIVPSPVEEMVEELVPRTRRGAQIEQKKTLRDSKVPGQVLMSKRTPKVRIEVSPELQDFQQKASMDRKSYPQRKGKSNQRSTKGTSSKPVPVIKLPAKTTDEAIRKSIRGAPAQKKKEKVVVVNPPQDDTTALTITRRSKRSLLKEEPIPVSTADLSDSESTGSRKRPRKMVKPKRHPEYKKEEEKKAEAHIPVKKTTKVKTPLKQKPIKTKASSGLKESSTKAAKSSAPSPSFKKSMMKRYSEKAPSPEKSIKSAPKIPPEIKPKAQQRSKLGSALIKKQMVKKTPIVKKKIGPKSKVKPNVKTFKSPLITKDLKIVLSQVNAGMEALKISKQKIIPVNLEDNDTDGSLDKETVGNKDFPSKDTDKTPESSTTNAEHRIKENTITDKDNIATVEPNKVNEGGSITEDKVLGKIDIVKETVKKDINDSTKDKEVSKDEACDAANVEIEKTAEDAEHVTSGASNVDVEKVTDEGQNESYTTTESNVRNLQDTELSQDEAMIDGDCEDKGDKAEIDEHNGENLGNQELPECNLDDQNIEPTGTDDNITPLEDSGGTPTATDGSDTKESDTGEVPDEDGSKGKDTDILGRALAESGLDEMASAMDQLDSGTLSTPAEPSPTTDEEEISL